MGVEILVRTYCGVDRADAAGRYGFALVKPIRTLMVTYQRPLESGAAEG